MYAPRLKVPKTPVLRISVQENTDQPHISCTQEQCAEHQIQQEGPTACRREGSERGEIQRINNQTLIMGAVLTPPENKGVSTVAY